MKPTKINGEPGNRPPIILRPSSLLMCASYQANGPSKGWCELIINLVDPSALLLGLIAYALEPVTKSSFSYKLEKLCSDESSNFSKLWIELTTPENKRFWIAKPATISFAVKGKCFLKLLLGFLTIQ